MTSKRYWVALVLALIAGYASASEAKSKSSSKSAKKQKLGKQIHLRSFDLTKRVALVEISGFSKPPNPNLFTFTDDRDRHFIAVEARCDPPFPSGTRACEVQIPAGYEKHKLTGLELHVGGLKSKSIAVTKDEVASVWDAAEHSRSPADTAVAKAPETPAPSPMQPPANIAGAPPVAARPVDGGADAARQP